MNSSYWLSPRTSLCAAALLSGLMLASCSTYHNSSPERVATSNPSVTYNYRNDDELIQAGQRAAEYCNQYQSVPQTDHFADDPKGGNVVVFECLPATASTASQPQFNANLTYDYRTDQELVDSARNAQLYCMNRGSRQVTSNVVAHSNGTRTVTFQCS